MLETPHVAVGAAIASKIPNPFIAIPLAFASHFILDITPHWNPHINREIKKYGHPTKQSINIIRIDSAVALVLGSALALHAGTPMQAANVLACSFVAVTPDVVEIPYYFLHKKYTVLEKWIAWQKSIQADAEPVIGLATQFIIVLVALFWIFS
ncbi:MAG TPA: hypothetical protein VG895_01500 [Patescibacteria group bacterium]|nr:hypothetical protein [Patescibacteria group bacterium]